MAKKKNWISKAVKHPGAFRAKAEKAGKLTSKGTIDPAWAKAQMSSANPQTAAQARLAVRFAAMHRGK